MVYEHTIKIGQSLDISTNYGERVEFGLTLYRVDGPGYNREAYFKAQGLEGMEEFLIKSSDTPRNLRNDFAIAVKGNSRRLSRIRVFVWATDRYDIGLRR